MIVEYHRGFIKPYLKLTTAVQQKATDRINLFLSDPTNSLLNIHKLNGKYLGYKSFNVTGNVRIVFRETGENKVLLIGIGTHSQLYK